jgi:hypothetical protein
MGNSPITLVAKSGILNVDIIKNRALFAINPN